MDNNIKTPNFGSIGSSKRTLHSFEEKVEQAEKPEKEDTLSTLNRLFSQTKPIDTFESMNTDILIDEEISSLENKERTLDLELNPEPLLLKETPSFSPPLLFQPPSLPIPTLPVESKTEEVEDLILDSWDEEDKIFLDYNLESAKNEEDFIIELVEELNDSTHIPNIEEKRDSEELDPTVEWHKDSERLFKEQNQEFYRFPGFPIKEIHQKEEKEIAVQEEPSSKNEEVVSVSEHKSDIIPYNKEKTTVENESKSDSWADEELPTPLTENEEFVNEEDYYVPQEHQTETEIDPTLLWQEEQEKMLLESVQEFNDPTTTIVDNKDSDLEKSEKENLENPIQNDSSSGWGEEDTGTEHYSSYSQDEDSDYQENFSIEIESNEGVNPFEEFDPTVHWQQEQESLIEDSDDKINDFDPTDMNPNSISLNKENKIDSEPEKKDDLPVSVTVPDSSLPFTAIGAGVIGAVAAGIVGVNPFSLDVQADAEAEADAEADAQADAEADVQADAEADVQADAEADVQADAEADVQADAEADAQADAQADVQTDAQADVQAETLGDLPTVIDLTQKPETNQATPLVNSLFSLNFTSKNDFNKKREEEYSGMKTEIKMFQPVIQDPKTIIKNASKRWNMNVPRTLEDKRKNPLYNDILSNLQRKLIPSDVRLSNIESFTRYKGTPIAIAFNQFNTDGKYTLFGLVDNPMRVEVRISKDTKHIHPIYKHLVLEEEFSELFQLYIQNQFDLEWTNKILDIFIQKNLVEVSPFLHENDEIIINRTGVFIKIRNLRNEDELEQTLSALFMLCDNLKKMNK